MTEAPGQTNPASPWVDLAANQPGQAGREHAAALYTQWRQSSWWRRRTTSRSEERQTRRRVAGDVFFARELRRLGPAWKVLHTVPGPEGDVSIDHLLIGPGGVYTVNARHQASSTVWLGDDTLMVDGERVHHLRDSRSEAAFATARLTAAVEFEVPVRGLVVIVGDRRFEVPCQPEDGSVRVTTPKSCVRWLRHLPDEWTEYGIDRIFAAARRSTTWTDPATAEADARAVGTAADRAPQAAAPPTRDVSIANIHQAAS
jgi:hypothetical protein